MKCIYIVSGFLILSACGGGGTTSGGGGSTAYTGTKPANSATQGVAFVRGYNSVADTVTVNLNGYNVVLSADIFRSRDGTIDIEAFSDALNDGSLPEFVSFRMVSSSGETSAELTARASAANIQGYPTLTGVSYGSNFSREGTTVIASSGTAQMTGKYVGTLSSDDLVWSTGAESADEFIYGDATFTADFGAGTIEGDITNRVAIYSLVPDYTPEVLDDLSLEVANIQADGSYSSTAILSDSAGSTGTFVGLISGADGTETTGFVKIRGSHGAESGVYVAE